jgi:hypothetical protein
MTTTVESESVNSILKESNAEILLLTTAPFAAARHGSKRSDNQLLFTGTNAFFHKNTKMPILCHPDFSTG